MKINKTSDTSAYIDIGSRTFYIDDSTNEGIMKTWKTNNPPTVKFIEGDITKIPTQPEIHYRNEGWINYANFLGLDKETS